MLPRARHGRISLAPFHGADHTVAIIKKAALESQNHYVVRQLAEAICGGLASKAYLDEYLAIFYFVLSHTRYMRDPKTVELVRDPWIVCEQIFAGQRPALDCDDMAALFCALILAVGGECRIVTIAFRHMHYRGRRQYSHVFVQAREPQSGKWITLDPVAGDDDRIRQMHGRGVAVKIYPVA